MPKQFLAAHERKNLASDRVVLVPGPPNEVECVREIYRMFIENRLSTREIASELNRRGVPYLGGRRWYQVGVYRILTHPKYYGCHVFGQRSQILHGPNVVMPRSSWCVVPNAFEPIVSRERFEEAQQIIHSRTFFKSNERVLEALRALWIEKGRLSQTIVNKAKDVPSTQTFWRRFGGLRNAYRLIAYSGIQASSDFTITRRRLLAAKVRLLGEIVNAFPGEVCVSRENWRQRLRLKLKDHSLVTVYVCQPHKLEDGSSRWYLNTARKEFCRLSLIARLNSDKATFLDFYLLPCLRNETRLTLKADDPRLSHGVRFTEPSQFIFAVRSLGLRRGELGTARRRNSPVRRLNSGGLY